MRESTKKAITAIEGVIAFILNEQFAKDYPEEVATAIYDGLTEDDDLIDEDFREILKDLQRTADPDRG